MSDVVIFGDTQHLPNQGRAVTLYDQNGVVGSVGKVTPAASATATLSNVAGSATSVTLLAANAGRLGAILINDSTAVLFLKYGATASATSYTYQLQPGATWEMPGSVLYTGVISGVWASATGSARVTELS